MMVTPIPSREEIPVELTWDLAAVFADDRAWDDAFVAVSRELPTFGRLQGTLGESGPSLYAALRARDACGEAIDRLATYALGRLHEDTTRARYQALADRVRTLATEFSAATAFYTPDILAIASDRLDAFYAAEPALELYRHHIADITRMRPHVRSAEVEQLLAAVSDVAQGPDRIFEMIDNADLRLPTITDAAGNEVQLSNSNYSVFTHSPDRRLRRESFEGMHEAFKAQQNTIAATLSAEVKKNVFFARARRYDSALEAAVGQDNIPAAVYTTLVETVNRRLAPLHRYLALRDRALALGDRQHMYDLYAPLVPEVAMTIPFDEAQVMLASALAPLGDEYVAALERGMRSRWIDVLESRGKLSGAYSGGAYGTAPFVLLNYQSRLDDLFTLAHEMGHSMHSYFTRQAQPYLYGDYTNFLAEIASTLNEALLTHYLLQTSADRAVRAYVVNHYLDGVRATLFRQTLFAEFELEIHRRAEAGEALTAEWLCGLYRGLNERYYGAGGIVVDELSAWEWARIPHFYMNFYVYQYATGLVAAATLTGQIIAEGQPAVDRYLRLLRSGSSNYSIDMVTAAGVDMTTPAPIEAAIAAFERAVADLERLL